MKRDPYFMKAKFNSTCPETGNAINKGDEIVYYPSCRQAFHIDGKNAENARALQISDSWGV